MERPVNSEGLQGLGGYPIIALPPGWPSWRLVMARALRQARLAGKRGEVPIGAVVIDGVTGKVLGEAGNSPIGGNDPTAHAEILALREACEAIGNYRLTGALVAVTLEPCLMCVGAMVHARIAGLVFGAADPKAGAVVSRLEGPALPFLNHRFPVRGGVLADQCGAVLTRFFANRRAEQGVHSRPDGMMA
jgi:tRNA(adenine34) deaminase